MKRVWGCLLAAALLAALAVPARADVIWEPFGDSFFDAHRDAVQYVGRNFLANGKAGYVTLWDAPGGSGVAAQYENGKALHVAYVYQDWALIDIWEEAGTGGWEETYGWTPLADLSLIYDCLSFIEEYEEDIRSYRDEFSGYDGGAATVNFYEYPGAAEIKYQVNWEDAGEAFVREPAMYIDLVFTDEEGRTWGYVPRYMGYRECWFCLDEPGGTDFPVREVAEPEFIPPQEPALPAAAYAPYVLAAGAVAVTAGLLVWFYGRKRKDPR